MTDLTVEIAGIHFKNPVWVASSEVTENFDRMKKAIDMGAGAVVAKSYTTETEVRRQTELAKYAILGYDRRPAYGRHIPKFYTNYCRSGIGRVHVSEEQWLEELARAQKYAEKSDSMIVGSVFGETDVDCMVRMAMGMEQAGIKMLELDLGCPQPEEMEIQGGLLKSSQEYVHVTRSVVQKVNIPVFVKLSPQQTDLANSAKGVKEAGAIGVTCHNRFLGFCVDIDNARPFIWGWAGVGGPWMLPLALRWVSKMHAEDPAFPVLGSSGVYDHEDIVQYLMAGASAVEVCSTIMVKGYPVIRKLIKGLEEFMDSKQYSTVREMVGIAVRASHTYEEMYTLAEYKERSAIDQDRCTRCGICFDHCWYGAIEKREPAHDKGKHSYVVNEALCLGCRSCKIICPVDGVISMRAVN